MADRPKKQPMDNATTVLCGKAVLEAKYHVLPNYVANASRCSPWKQSSAFTTAKLGIPVSVASYIGSFMVLFTPMHCL
jgi:hypothetical protein